MPFSRKQDNPSQPFSLKSARWPSLALLIGLCAVMIFQNCAEPLNLAEQDAASFNNSLPFAYDTQIDTISYMSCTGFSDVDNSRAFFTFRVGAYGDNSGIRLSDAFLEKTKNFSRIQRARSLAEGEKNSGVMLQLSVRNNQNYQQPFSNQNSWEHSFDYYNFLMPLSKDPIAEALSSLEVGQRENYFTGYGGFENHFVEGSIRFPENTDEDRFRSLIRNGVLSMAYTTFDTQSKQLSAPDLKDPNRVYGRGYKVGFRSAFGIQNDSTNKPLYSSSEHRAINIEREYSLQDSFGAALGQWSCSNDDTYIVVRRDDRASGKMQCPPSAENPNALSGAQKAKLAKIRRVLRVEDWEVNIDRNCVVPRADVGACYPTGQNMDLNINYSGGSCDGDTCPHYVTVCTRN